MRDWGGISDWTTGKNDSQRRKGRGAETRWIEKMGTDPAHSTCRCVQNCSTVVGCLSSTACNFALAAYKSEERVTTEVEREREREREGIT